MLFYKIEGTIKNHSAEAEENRRAQRENARKVYLKSEEFNQKHRSSSCFFVSDTSDGIAVIGVITDQPDKLMKTADAFIKHLGYCLEDVLVQEITFGGIQALLRSANRYGYIEDDDDVMVEFGLDRLSGRIGRGIEFGDNIIENRDRKDMIQQIQKYLLSDTLLPELERIYAGTAPSKCYGHPVHYFLQTDDRDIRREGYRILLQALYANQRIQSRRYSFVDIRPGEDFSVMTFDALYRICAGGAVVIRYFAQDDSEESDLANSETQTIETICHMVKRYRNHVLSIICLPRECKNAKALFYENLGTMSMVEIMEDFAADQRAQAYLKMLARENHIRTDKDLFSKLEEGKGYLAPDLQEIFDEWYNKKLKTRVYPQYKELTVAKQKAAKAAPKGSAYDELQVMIGLKEAKAVIQKALNFYKMQKLYEENGMKRDCPAMHMVFSGNPGTAKTTVARLFARIMKDNGLLSKGQLIEVGRGDLVGKYVGWTAKTVQAKFKAALGGVLFIDEAYSLVDGHSGSYGDEAINTIVQEMENHRKEVVVIFAGYPDQMEAFLRKNPGLRSRIAFHVPFEDYDAGELCEIAALMGKQKGINFDPEAMDKLKTAFEKARKQNDFGNGRYCRNLLEQARMNQASRLLEQDFQDITIEEISTIKAVDIVVPEIQTEEIRRIGFAC